MNTYNNKSYSEGDANPILKFRVFENQNHFTIITTAYKTWTILTSHRWDLLFSSWEMRLTNWILG